MLTHLYASELTGFDIVMIRRSLGGSVFHLHGKPDYCFSGIQKTGPTQILNTEGKSPKEIKNEIQTQTKSGIPLIISGSPNVELGFLLKMARDKNYSIIFSHFK